ncbi:hypothetical protein [Streptomyces beihaiensis]|uniref:Uncharacterized protein n=1 Tax=Streptomyces beihaiensis TaxID=2984495 RepID=A0ABT3TTE4_9ACTN|nr:hypothetical protein [Streptomyces beihaiensis]MCX3060314.1 hypothetical protein [Streptomyces beihaiensis]
MSAPAVVGVGYGNDAADAADKEFSRRRRAHARAVRHRRGRRR